MDLSTLSRVAIDLLTGHFSARTEKSDSEPLSQVCTQIEKNGARMYSTSCCCTCWETLKMTVADIRCVQSSGGPRGTRHRSPLLVTGTARISSASSMCSAITLSAPSLGPGPPVWATHLASCHRSLRDGDQDALPGIDIGLRAVIVTIIVIVFFSCSIAHSLSRHRWG